MPQVLNSTSSLLQKTSVQVVIIFVVLYATFFQNLQAIEPSLMEARNFITVREIMQNNTWLIPTLNGEPRLAKPPLPTWLTAFSVLINGDLYNLTALRFPAACISALLVYFLFLFTRRLTSDRLIPFLASLVLATSFSFFNIGRQGTWDIYCHSFMMGGLWLLLAGLQNNKKGYGLFLSSGFLMGLSFLSKGPVSFYALLLPFLFSYAYGFRNNAFKKHSAGIIITVAVCLLVSFAWPIYVYLQEPARMATNISNESTAWVNRHVKPFWFYISFPWQAGIWAVFAVAALAIPYARHRISTFGNYRFLSGWVISCFILLSVIPEKKERYLLPLLLPLALLTAYYLRYLWEAFQNRTTTKPDRFIFQLNIIVYLILCIGIPLLLYFFAYQNQLISAPFLLCFSSLFLVLAFCLLVIWRQQNFKFFIASAIVIHVLALYVLMPRFRDMVRPVQNFTSLDQVRQQEDLKLIPFYVVQEMSPEHIWEVGKKVNAVNWNQKHVEIPKTLPAALFSKFLLQSTNLPDATVNLKKIGYYQYDRRHPEQVYYLYLLTRSK